MPAGSALSQTAEQISQSFVAEKVEAFFSNLEANVSR